MAPQQQVEMVQKPIGTTTTRHSPGHTPRSARSIGRTFSGVFSGLGATVALAGAALAASAVLITMCGLISWGWEISPALAFGLLVVICALAAYGMFILLSCASAGKSPWLRLAVVAAVAIGLTAGWAVVIARM